MAVIELDTSTIMFYVIPIDFCNDPIKFIVHIEDNNKNEALIPKL